MEQAKKEFLTICFISRTQVLIERTYEVHGVMKSTTNRFFNILNPEIILPSSLEIYVIFKIEDFIFKMIRSNIGIEFDIFWIP